MKDGKLKKILVIVIVVLLICSIGYSSYRKRTQNPYRYTKVNITFNENESHEESLDEVVQSSSDVLFEEESSVVETIVSNMETNDEDLSESAFQFSGSGVVTKDNLQEVLISIIKTDNMEDLNSMPVSENLYNQLVASNGVSDTLSSGSEVDMRICGISENNEFMCMFITQTSSYYLSGIIVNDRIDYIECKELR